MYHDVNELRNFYYRTYLGRTVQRRLQQAILDYWGEERGEVFMGFGFALPLMRPLLNRFDNVVNLMPAAQGVLAWPPGEKNISVLCEETAWPIGAVQIDHMVVLHALENTEDISGLLAEISRVLSPQGRVIFIVPNRNGVWASSDHTPFGYGRPYSYSQMERLLRQHRFDILRHSGALYAPPMRSRAGLKTYPFWEWMLGKSRSKLFAGAILIEAKKQAGYVPPKLAKREPIFAPPDLIPAHRSPG